MMNEIAVIESPVGKLRITVEQQQLASIELNCEATLQPAASSSCKQVCQQLNAYFSTADNLFQVSILAQGTVFQRSVWAALSNIPKGEVRTYGELAKQLGTSARALGNACRRNPTPIIVPCHRVVAASGLGGFAGEVGGKLTAIKKTLLLHEGVKFD